MSEEIPLERMDAEAPKEIVELLGFPYKFFGNLCGGKDISLMDIASGEGHQKKIVDDLFEKCVFYDVEFENDFVKKGDIRDIPQDDKSIDVSFCFETIEHLNYEDQLKALSELERVTRKFIVIGSVDGHGHDYIDGVVIFKKTNNNLNPFHIRELDSISFPSLIEEQFKNIDYYQSWKSSSKPIVDGGLGMRYGLWTRPKSYCNYALISL
jgi:ubiquinone/menaquinone biosynthesis C-methylase UbiE